jgi:hypothetical protein
VPASEETQNIWGDSSNWHKAKPAVKRGQPFALGEKGKTAFLSVNYL